MKSDSAPSRSRTFPSASPRHPSAHLHRDPRVSARRRRLATAAWGIALHVALAVLFAGPLAAEDGLAYAIPAALAVLAPRTFGRAGLTVVRGAGRVDHRGARLPRIVQLACESAGWYVFTIAGSSDLRVASVGGPDLPGWLAATLGAAAATGGSLLLSRREPSARAARHRRRGLSIVAAVPLAVALAMRTAQHHHAVLIAEWTGVSLLMLLVAILTLVRGQYSWQVPERVRHVDLADVAAPRHRFSLIIPARDEPILGRTLTQILAGDYPADLLELVVMVSHDEVDRPTRRIAEQIADRHPNVHVIAPEGNQRSKPLSLEDARRHCTGDIVGIVDAESLIAGGLLTYVNTLAQRQAEVGIFQGGVQLMNVRGPGASHGPPAPVGCARRYAGGTPGLPGGGPATAWSTTSGSCPACASRHGRASSPSAGTPCSSAGPCWSGSAAGTSPASPRTATSGCAPRSPASARRCSTTRT